MMPLTGLRVADFTWIGAGSYTTKLLADFGADVVKVETATRMDTLRSTPPFKDGKRGVNRSGYFADRNTSKRSVLLNLKNPRGLEVARGLVAQADILANNFSPGTMEKLGLGYAEVVKIKPDIIYISMSMQGSDGPDRDYIGFGLTIGALSGVHHLSGEANRPPAGTSTNYPDHVPNPCHGAFAVLAALHHRRRTGQGQFIDLSQTEPTIALIGATIADCSANGRVAERCGNDAPGAAPRGVYPCAGDDRWIAITVREDREWQSLAEILDPAEAPEAWTHAAARLADRRGLDAWVGSRTTSWDAYALMRALQAAGVASGVVQDASDLVDRDPQFAHRQHWRRLRHAEMGETLYNAPPFHLSRTPAALRRPAPLLGEHTEEVCRDLLGMTPEEYDALRADGVFE